MAQWFFSNSRAGASGDDSKVVVGTSAPSADFYLQILSTNSPTKEDTVNFLKQMIRHVESNGIMAGKFGVDQPFPS